MDVPIRGWARAAIRRRGRNAANESRSAAPVSWAIAEVSGRGRAVRTDGRVRTRAV